MANGFQFVSQYTFSKTVTDTATFSGDSWNYHPHLGRGESPTSHRHRLLISGIYQPEPIMQGTHNPLLVGVVKGSDILLVGKVVFPVS